MVTVPPTRPLKVALVAVVATMTTAVPQIPAFAATYAQIEGTGSTWSQGIVSQWIADVDANGLKVVYSGGGSSKGRRDFASGLTDFGVTEVPYGFDGDANDSAGSRQFAYVPLVGGGLAFAYHVTVGGKLLTNLQLSGPTITKIFANQITNWNDQAITRDNDGKALPSLPITPVVRSDRAGSSAQFTRWMTSEYPNIWTGGQTSFFPRSGKAVGQSGSDQVMNFIAGSAGNGTIGYLENSYAANRRYPVAAVKNRSGRFVRPTSDNVTVALRQAKLHSDGTSDLTGVYAATDLRAYPISYYADAIIPTGAVDQRMTTSKRNALVDFLGYASCEGQSKAGAYGFAPLPKNLTLAALGQLSRLGTADPAVDTTRLQQRVAKAKLGRCIPDHIAPSIALRAPATRIQPTNPIAVRWAANDDPSGWGLKQFQVRWTKAPPDRALIPWQYPSRWRSIHHSLRQIDVTLPANYTYCYSVRAIDQARNASPWSARRCVTYRP